MIYLKELTKKHISNSYLNWMNDYEVQKFTEQKYKKHTRRDISKFVDLKKKSKNEFLYGIFLKNKHEHIGNIKLGPINRIHKFADISYFIGNKNYWGKGYTTLAIASVIKIAKKKGVKKLQARYYQMNFGSKKVLEKNKFKLEATLKSQIVFKKKRYNSYWYGLVL
jgi:[ribosomal protein S5]-alanine N-acetyltransferase